jgi:hypothetical protein
MLTKQAILDKISRWEQTHPPEDQQRPQARTEPSQRPRPSIDTPKQEKPHYEPARHQKQSHARPLPALPALENQNRAQRPEDGALDFLQGIDPDTLRGIQLSAAERIVDGGVFLASLQQRYTAGSDQIHATAARHVAVLRAVTGILPAKRAANCV